MTFRVIIEARAEADLLAQAEWIRDQGSSEAAERWLGGIQAAIMSLGTLPARCPLAPEAGLTGLEIRQLVYKSHRVLFIVSGREVHVLHVRHGARLPLGQPETE